MTEQDTIHAALSIRIPQQISWAARCGEDSWSGNDLSGLVARLEKRSDGQPVTLSLSLVFELTGNDGTVRSADEEGEG